MTGDKKMEFYRDEMIRDLRESDCNVIFTKVNVCKSCKKSNVFNIIVVKQ